MEQNISIKTNEYNIPGILEIPEIKQDKYPAVLFLHGFIAYKQGDGFLFEKLAKVLSKAGIASLRIDCCSCGENRRNRNQYGLCTIKKEAEEAFNYLKNLDIIDENKVGIIGHSLGGKIAIKSANLNPWLVITLGGHLADESLNTNPEYISEDKDGKKFLIVYCSDGRSEVIYDSFYKQEKEFYKIEYDSLTCPVLLCVGKKDFTVDQAMSVNYYNNLNNDNKKLLYIEDANHTFNAKTGDYTKVYELADKIVDWVNQCELPLS